LIFWASVVSSNTLVAQIAGMPVQHAGARAGAGLSLDAAGARGGLFYALGADIGIGPIAFAGTLGSSTLNSPVSAGYRGRAATVSVQLPRITGTPFELTLQAGAGRAEYLAEVRCGLAQLAVPCPAYDYWYPVGLGIVFTKRWRPTLRPWVMPRLDFTREDLGGHGNLTTRHRTFGISAGIDVVYADGLGFRGAIDRRTRFSWEQPSGWSASFGVRVRSQLFRR
jgi:hypothetical protein